MGKFPASHVWFPEGIIKPVGVYQHWTGPPSGWVPQPVARCYWKRWFLWMGQTCWWLTAQTFQERCRVQDGFVCLLIGPCRTKIDTMVVLSPWSPVISPLLDLYAFWRPPFPWNWITLNKSKHVCWLISPLHRYGHSNGRTHHDLSPLGPWNSVSQIWVVRTLQTIVFRKNGGVEFLPCPVACTMDVHPSINQPIMGKRTGKGHQNHYSNPPSWDALRFTKWTLHPSGS